MALEWMQAAQRDFGIEVTPDAIVAQEAAQVFQFKRSGLAGVLRVTEAQFVLEISLGFLLGTFKERIEAEILKNLEIRLKKASSGFEARD